MVNSRDVAIEAGVSQATVSRVLTAGANVTPETRSRVLDAMRRIGYVPNIAAQALKTGRTGTVGVVVTDLVNPFYPQLLGALGHAFDDAGMRMTVWIADGTRNDAALQAIRDGSVDGVLFTTVTEQSVELRSALERRSPIVLVNRIVPDTDCDQVASDNRVGGALVAEHFVGHDRRRPAFIGGTRAASTSRARLAGYTEALDRLGVALEPAAALEGEFTHADGFRSMQRLIDSDRRPDAVFCSNDLLAFGAIDAARRSELRVPEDVWIVGYDDTDMASWPAFDLTTVRQDIQTLARAAADLLVTRVADRTLPARELVLPPVLVERGSTASGTTGARA